jgi:5-(carboxyamino)imidazole ribonucleotide synthase
MRPISPGSTLGVLGAGQLGRMFALAAARLGYRVAVLAAAPTDPAAQVAAEVFLTGDDPASAAARMARSCAAITLEFESVPAALARAAAERAPVRPAPQILEIAQDRQLEKDFLRAAGVPVAPYLAVDSPQGAETAVVELGLPLVFKTATTGYDGHGQARVAAIAGAGPAFASLGGGRCVAEAFVDFAFEISVIVARGIDGQTAVYPPFRNDHRDHVLEVTSWPAPGLEPGLAAAAEALAVRIAQGLELVGLICVEMFVSRTGELIVNEIAPRPHNSGHVTIEAAQTDQFEQQVRAVCGLPLGSPAPRSAGAMINLLGEVFTAGEPDWAQVLAEPGVHLHLYGKSGPRPGRKMGHITALDPEPQRAAARLRAIHARLRHPTAPAPRTGE